MTGRTSPSNAPTTMNFMRGPSPSGDRSTTPTWQDDRPPVSVLPGGGAFDTYPDYSRINSGRHTSSRHDTFQTPTRMHRQNATQPPTPTSFAACGTKEVLEVCELSFAKNLRSMHMTLLKDLKDEINTALGPLKLELSGTIADARGATAMERILKEIKSIEVPAVDMAPVHGKLVDIERASEKASAGINQRLSEDLGALRGEIQEVQQHQKQVEGVRSQRIEGIEGTVHRLEEQLTKLCTVQAGESQRSSQIAVLVQQAQAASVSLESNFVSSLEAQLVKQVKDNPVNVNFEGIVCQLSRSHEAVAQDFSILLKEIAKVQKALNVDFAHWIEHKVEEKVEECVVLSSSRSGSKTGYAQAQQSERRPSFRNRNKLELEGSASVEFNSSLSLRVGRRMRDIGLQTETPPEREMACQTEGVWQQSSKQIARNARGSMATKPKAAIMQKKLMNQKNMFADAEVMKARARDALIKPQYSVFDEYRTKGIIQAIARSPIFESATLIVIVLNSLWMAIDTDHNQAALLIEAEPEFLIVENLFCLYFFAEICIRFFAFRKKKRVVRDFWFIFDSILVSLMVVETWVITIVAEVFGMRDGSFIGDVSILRCVRILRMLRISRVARVVRAIPELVILLKGVFAASRSVSVFFLLWLVLIYIYALILRQIAEQTNTQEAFPDVASAMSSLLLDGILPEYSLYVNSLTKQHPAYGPIMFSFIALAVMTLMNMLVGVLVEVVGSIAMTEKESISVMSLASSLREAMLELGLQLERPLRKEEFQNLLVQEVIATIISSAGVDVLLLVEMVEAIFDDLNAAGSDGLMFEGFVELVLNMRGTNPAKVKDIKEQLRLIKTCVNTATNTITTRFDEEFVDMKLCIQEIKELCEDNADLLEATPGAQNMAMSRRNTVKSNTLNVSQEQRHTAGELHPFFNGDGDEDEDEDELE